MGARSMTSMIICAIGISLLLFGAIYKNDLKKFVRSMISILLISLFFIIFWGSSFFTTIIKLTGRDSSFTGRIPLWNDLIAMSNQNFLIGSGFEGFWLVHFPLLWNKYQFLPIQSHNGYLDIYLDLGLIGFTLLILLIALYVIFKLLIKSIFPLRLP